MILTVCDYFKDLFYFAGSYINHFPALVFAGERPSVDAHLVPTDHVLGVGTDTHRVQVVVVAVLKSGFQLAFLLITFFLLMGAVPLRQR